MALPTVLEELLKPYPVEIQLKFREALERLRLVNPDDPILELMLVLGLFGSYYQKTSGNVVEAGRIFDHQFREGVESLDQRVRLLQGLTQTIQQATDRLEGAGQEIVSRFPVADIAAKVTERVDATIQGLPIENLLRTVVTTQQEMASLSRSTEGAAEKLLRGAKMVEDVAKRLTDAGLPRVSFLWTMGCVLFGFYFALLMIWWIRPDLVR